MTLKRLFLPFLMLICSSTAIAQEPGNTEIQISQTFPSKSLGTLLLPFGWNAENIDSQKRIIATEPNTPAPAILTIDLIENLPKDMDNSALANHVATAMAESIQSTAEIKAEEINFECDSKKNCPTLTIYRSSFKGIEKNVERQCAIEIIPASQRMIVLTICGVASKNYYPDFPEILDQVFSGMK